MPCASIRDFFVREWDQVWLMGVSQLKTGLTGLTGLTCSIFNLRCGQTSFEYGLPVAVICGMDETDIIAGHLSLIG